VATEATARILEVGFEELALHRVVLRIAEGNRASERVAEKLGFTREGLLRQELQVNGVWMDHSIWGLLEDEYDQLKPGYAEAGWLTA
jgi:ribosomal-protein-alanine N-acetyltransferase